MTEKELQDCLAYYASEKADDCCPCCSSAAAVIEKLQATQTDLFVCMLQQIANEMRECAEDSKGNWTEASQFIEEEIKKLKGN